MGLELDPFVSLGSGLVLVGSFHSGFSLKAQVHPTPCLSIQVCLCVAANVAYSLQQKILYIDSNGGLTASRILQLLQARTPDEEEQVRDRKMVGFL